jgi:TolB-like protein/predicted Ser/Thr protein kinase
MPLPAGTRLGSYAIERLLGAGGMGEVYLARDARLGREVALKILPSEVAADPDRRARFEREARMAAALKHAHICTIFEVAEVSGQLFIAMEYVEGTTLRDRVRVDSFSLTEILDIAIQIADALDEARQKKVVHRDLKSANILLTPRGEVKILDFGLAKRVEEARPPDATTEGGVTDAGMVIGTAAYMSPEQALGQPVDHRSDLFSFGVVLYELLTGRLPFTGKTSMELFSAILHGAPPPIPRFNEQVPDALVRVVAKLLEKGREQRYQSAREVLTDLQKIRDEGAPTSGMRATSAWRPGWRMGVAGAAVVAAGIALALWSPPFRQAAVGSVVVLPAQVLTDAPELLYLGDAVAVALSNRLFQVEGLDTKVPPKSQDLRQFKDERRVAEAFGVSRYVTSVVLAQDKILTVTVRVVGSEDSRVLWSHEYTGTLEGFVPLMQESANGVQKFLQPASAKLAPTTSQEARSEVVLAFEAGEYFVRQYNNSHDPPDFEAAQKSLKRALTLDPQLAEAEAQLARLFVFRLEGGGSPAEMLPQVVSHAERAIALDKNTSTAWASLAYSETLQPRANWLKALEWALKGAARGRRNAAAHEVLGEIYPMGPSLPLECQRESRRLDPLYLYPPLNAAADLLMLGRSLEGLELVGGVLTVAPNNGPAMFEQALLLADLDRPADAAAVTSRLKSAAASGQFPEFLWVVADYAVRVQHGEPATAQQQAVLAGFRDSNTPSGFIAEGLKVVPLLMRRHLTDAAGLLLHAAADHEVIPPYEWLTTNPDLGSLRQDPTFAPLIARSKAQFAGILAALEAARRDGDLPTYLERPLADLRKRLAM